MAKLKDDQIKWILSLDAKGVQGEVNALSNKIRTLKVENTRLNKEMKDASKQMKEAEKAMVALEKAGDTSSNKYKELKGTFEGARDEIAAYSNKVKENSVAIKEEEESLNKLEKTMQVGDMTMTQLRKRANDLQKQLDNTSEAADPAAYAQLQTELSSVRGRMGDLKNSGKSLGEQLTSMPGPVGLVAKGFYGLKAAFNAIIANPVGVILAAIVVVFMAFKKAINSSEEATNKFNQILAPLGALLDWLLSLVQKVVGKFLDFIIDAIAWLMKLAESLPFVGDEMKKINEKAMEAIELEKAKQALAKRKRDNLVEDSALELKVEKLKNESKKKDLFTEELRLAKVREAMALERKRAEEKKAIADENSRIMEAEAARAENDAETNEKLAQAAAERNKAEMEYYKRTNELASQEAELINAIKREKEEEHKKFIEAQIKREEQALLQIQIKLKKDLSDNLITEKQYNEAVEKATIESLTRKLKIKGLEKQQVLQFEQQLLDAVLAANDKADKAQLEAFKKTQEEQLALLDEGHKIALEKLNEQEKDKTLLAIKTRNLEASFAQERLSLLIAQGEAIKQTEFKNAELQQEAIKANAKAIAEADKEAQKLRLAAQKEFLNKAAELEKQVFVKTLDERQKEELEALNRLYEARNEETGQRLLSDEAYQIAKTAIERKYEDERMAVRQQYGLITTSELFDQEMDLLKEQYAQKLISEEEFETAKLQLRIKYAQELTQRVSNVLNLGSNAIQAIQQAETANLEAEYAQRLSALQEQLNAGIISQEQFAEQKSQLEYQEKKEALEIQKKYADANFAMQVAQISASLAQGIMGAWATSIATLGPIAGSIAATALTALLAVTGAAQISAANAERKRIKSLTLESPGSGSASKTKPPKPALEGNVTLKNKGFADGGYTGDGDKYEVAGYLYDGRPYHRGEYFVAQEEMRHPEVIPLVRKIETVRRRRTSANPLPEGFAEGGYTGKEESGSSEKELTSVLQQLHYILLKLSEEPIQAEVNYFSLKEAEKKMDMVNKNLSL
ncbi:MAG: SHOCT domain-containing protein [Bacteroidales bacterium]|nr:SHOCT domain-containing protein [Bacteroidales bacterium]MBN2749919.1 SHOCT domain-containing protein [Bacteroidales bacterium]